LTLLSQGKTFRLLARAACIGKIPLDFHSRSDYRFATIRLLLAPMPNSVHLFRARAAERRKTAAFAQADAFLLQRKCRCPSKDEAFSFFLRKQE
jgi:hypothetical protein